MENTSIQEFLDSLTEEQRQAVLACKTEEELAKVISDYDIEIPLEMLEGVSGGVGKFIPAALAAIMMLSAGSAIAADASIGAPASGNAVVTQLGSNLPAVPAFAAANSAIDQKALATTWKTGFAVFTNFVPAAKVFEPILSPLFDTLPDALQAINDNINKLREEMNERLNDLEKGLSQSTKVVLNRIKNQAFVSGLGSELDKLHTSVEGIARQIDTIQDDEKLTDNEKAVEIAAMIGKSSEWNKDTNLVFKVKNIGNALAGKSFADTDGRDLYQVAYDYAAGDTMFSGEAYDAAAPYIDRVMYEYFLAYSVLTECFQAADTVSKFTDAQVEALSLKEKNNYYSAASTTSLVASELLTITDQIFKSSTADSVVSHYSVFKYAQEYDRNVFINRGTVSVPISGVNAKDRSVAASRDFDKKDLLLSQAKDDVQSGFNASAINPKDIKTIYTYFREKYSGQRFRDFLGSAGIGMEQNNYGYFPTSDKVYVNEEFKSYRRSIDIGFTGFSPNSDSPGEQSIKCYRWYHAGSSVFSFTLHSNEVYMFYFVKGSRTVLPITADEVCKTDSRFDAIRKQIIPDYNGDQINKLSYIGFVQNQGWGKWVENGATAGTIGKSLRMEAIIINLKNRNGSSAVKYRVHVEKKGWMDWCSSGEVAGTTKDSLRAEAVEIELTGDYAKNYDVVYRTYVEGKGWTDWVKNGETSGTTGQSKRIEGIEIKLVSKIKRLPILP